MISTKNVFIFLIFFCSSNLFADSQKPIVTNQKNEVSQQHVPALNINIETSLEAQKILTRFKENIIIMAKYEGLRANGQFAGPEPPKVLSRTVSKKGGRAKFESFDLLDFDKSPLHFGGIMIQAINTQTNTRQLLVNCSSFSLYPKKAKVLQERFKKSIPISCRASTEK